jgi:hypothetical protein
MNAVTGIVKDGRVSLEAPADWPEGCPVIVEPIPAARSRVGIDESEWHNDPASLADWDGWIKTIEPLDLTPDELATFTRFDDEMRRHNIEAVRQQMTAQPLP